MQDRVKAVFIRGGTSKGVFFHAGDLPDDPRTRDEVILKVLGSPDPNGRQLNGMGGGISSLSKAVIISPSTRDDADIDYTFAQVVVDQPLVDYGSNCGNLSSAVGPFCVDEGLLQRADGEALVRIHNTNTQRVVHARFTVRDGLAEVDGDFVLAGVAGTGSSVKLSFLEPGGAVTGSLMPDDVPRHELVDPRDGARYDASLVDASNATVFITASALGLTGTELPDIIERDAGLMAKMDRLRRAGGVKMGLGSSPDEVPLSNPKFAIVSAPADYETLDGATLAASEFDVAVRVISMERIHRASPLTTGMSVAAAVRIPGTLAAELASASEDESVRVGHPSGVLVVGAVLSDADTPHIAQTVVYRSARRLMEGVVLVPRSPLCASAA